MPTTACQKLLAGLSPRRASIDAPKAPDFDCGDSGRLGHIRLASHDAAISRERLHSSPTRHIIATARAGPFAFIKKADRPPRFPNDVYQLASRH